jgi:hypothetical protein
MSDNIQEELDRLDKFNSPMAIIKKAFSSFGVILLIGGGMVFSFILGVVYLLGWGAIVPTVWLLGGLVLLMLVFPAAYLFAAFTFGRALIFWEAYQEAVKPMVAKIVASIFNQFFPDGKTHTEDTVTDELLNQELEQQSSRLTDKLPDFISSRLELLSTFKAIIHTMRLQKRSGVANEQIKSKAMAKLFAALDEQLSGVVSAPSILPIGGLVLVNIGFFIFLIS